MTVYEAPVAAHAVSPVNNNAVRAENTDRGNHECESHSAQAFIIEHDIVEHQFVPNHTLMFDNWEQEMKSCPDQCLWSKSDRPVKLYGRAAREVLKETFPETGEKLHAVIGYPTNFPKVIYFVMPDSYLEIHTASLGRHWALGEVATARYPYPFELFSYGEDGKKRITTLTFEGCPDITVAMCRMVMGLRDQLLISSLRARA